MKISFIILFVICYSTYTFTQERQDDFDKFFSIMNNFNEDPAQRDSAYLKIESMASKGNIKAISFFACIYLKEEATQKKGVEYAQIALSNKIYYVGLCLSEYYLKKGDIANYLGILEKTKENFVSKLELGYFLIYGKSYYLSFNNQELNFSYSDNIDFIKGYKILDELSKENIIDAFYLLGEIHYQGIFIEKDYKKSKEYFLSCKNHDEYDDFIWYDKVEKYLRDTETTLKDNCY